jgi:hypothetical protein
MAIITVISGYVLHFRRVLFTIKLLHKCFHFLCLLLMPYWTSLFVFYLGHVDKSSLNETLFHCNILSKHHHARMKTCRKPIHRRRRFPLAPKTSIRCIKDTIWLSYDPYMTAKLYFDTPNRCFRYE